jgi:hypothetical protein
LPVVPSDNGLAALSGTTFLGAALSNRFSAAASDLFPPPSPYPYTNALAALGAPSPPAVGASSLLFGAPAAPTPPWHYVRWRFREFLANLTITPPQREDGTTKQSGVRACLNRHYYGTTSETANSFLIGSWGKGTQVRPSRDIDILFLLPVSVWQRYQLRDGNKQSQLLQEVKEILAVTYSQTTMRGDGQVIAIPFNTIPVEMSPGFRCQDGTIIICDTNDGGRYKASTAEAEESELSNSDRKWNGKHPRARTNAQAVTHRRVQSPVRRLCLYRNHVYHLAAHVAYYPSFLRCRANPIRCLCGMESYGRFPGLGSNVGVAGDGNPARLPRVRYRQSNQRLPDACWRDDQLARPVPPCGDYRLAQASRRIRRGDKAVA